MKVTNLKKKCKAFSMAEMLVVMLILGVLIVSMVPIAVRRVKKPAVNPEHGSFECFYGDAIDEDTGDLVKDVLIQRTRDGNGQILSDQYFRVQDYCEFTPKRGAMFFAVNAVGGGSPGTGVESVFNGSYMPLGDGGTSGRRELVNYRNVFYKFQSYILGKDESIDGERVDFSRVIGESGDNSPEAWLRANGMDMRTILTSDGGFLTNEDGAAFAILEHNNDPEHSEECHGASYPDFTKLNFNIDSETGEMVGESLCFKLRLYEGRNPEYGTRVMMGYNIKTGNTFKSSNPKDDREPFFVRYGENVIGCRLTAGGNGCYNYHGLGYDRCTPEKGKYYNYDDSINCEILTLKKAGKPDISEADGYPNNHYTLLEEDISNSVSSSVRSEVLDDLKDHHTFVKNNCDWNLKDPDGSPCMPDNWLKYSNFNSGYRKFFVLNFGRFALADEESAMGLNFYAKAGNPGEYKTMYVSRFGYTVRIYPGRPVEPSTSINSQKGNDTKLYYYRKLKEGEVAIDDNGNPIEDADRNAYYLFGILTAKGGQKAVPDASSDETFIIGNLFELPSPGDKRIIAYDTENGRQAMDDSEMDLAEYRDLDNSEDISGRLNEYGTYFLPKESGFIYPVPDSENLIPNTVGQGGHGAYTIYRRSGKSHVYELLKVIFGASSKTERSFTGSDNAEYANDKYICRSDKVQLTGTTSRHHRCYAGKGKGGAVVITW